MSVRYVAFSAAGRAFIPGQTDPGHDSHWPIFSELSLLASSLLDILPIPRFNVSIV